MDHPELIVIRRYSNAMDATIAKSALEAAGLAAAIRADDCGGMRPHLQMSGVELVVRAEDGAEANGILVAGEGAPQPDSE